MDTIIYDTTENALVEFASDPGEPLPHDLTEGASVTSSADTPDPEQVRARPHTCEFMVGMDPKGDPRHQCPNPPSILMELDIGVSPTYRWACHYHANERLVPLKVMIVRRFKGQP